MVPEFKTPLALRELEAENPSDDGFYTVENPPRCYSHALAHRLRTARISSAHADAEAHGNAHAHGHADPHIHSYAHAHAHTHARAHPHAPLHAPATAHRTRTRTRTRTHKARARHGDFAQNLGRCVCPGAPTWGRGPSDRAGEFRHAVRIRVQIPCAPRRNPSPGAGHAGKVRVGGGGAEGGWWAGRVDWRSPAAGCARPRTSTTPANTVLALSLPCPPAPVVSSL